MEFKIGDKIKLKGNIKDVIIDNALFMGEIVKKYDMFTIKSIETSPCNHIRVKEDCGEWMWLNDWFEKVKEESQPIHDEIYLSYIGDTTIAVHEKVGIATRSKHDKEDRKIGILIATMRAIGFDKTMINKVIDVLFDDIKDIKDYTDEELLKEISRRMK